MPTLNETPNSNRLHIGVFGRTNSGKSSLINALTRQEVSIVADVAGTTTDLVYKAMEIHPLGPCVLIDTAGFDDISELGKKRVEKTIHAVEKSDVAILVLSLDMVTEKWRTEGMKFSDVFPEEAIWYEKLSNKKIPVLVVVNKVDQDSVKAQEFVEWTRKQLGPEIEILGVSCRNRDGIDRITSSIARILPEDYGTEFITGKLIKEDDLVLLVMPQDIQAPKGRLILPQVQTIRELLDRKCITICVTADKIKQGLSSLVKPPKLIITDSQVFPLVYETKPKESMLTSFSILFAAYKGDLTYYIEGAKAIDTLTENSRVLIAECCTHAPLAEDIGRVKIPNMLRKRFGKKLIIEHVSGTDFPKDLAKYDLIIQCGGCMFNRRYILSRIDRAKQQKIPMTNYGVTIAHITGILEYKTT